MGLRKPRRVLPPLEVGAVYQVEEFERFELGRLGVAGSDERTATLHLHLKNGTILDLPTTEAALQRLALVLAQAYGQVVIENFRAAGWIPSEPSSKP